MLGPSLGHSSHGASRNGFPPTCTPYLYPPLIYISSCKLFWVSKSSKNIPELLKQENNIHLQAVFGQDREHKGCCPDWETPANISSLATWPAARAQGTSHSSARQWSGVLLFGTC